MKKKNLSNWIAILATIMFVCVACNNASSPNGVVKRYYDTLLKGNYKKAIAIRFAAKMYEVDDKEVNEISEKLAGLWNFYSANGFTGYEIISESIDSSGVLIVEVKEFYKYREEKTTHWYFEKTNDKWLHTEMLDVYISD